MKKLVIILLVLSVMPLISRGKTIPLPVLNNPDSIAVDGEKFFVTERASVYIFSLKTYALLNQFGRSGQGPEEFAQSSGLSLSLQPNSLVINSTGKISIFSKEGKFIKEQRTPVGANYYLPLGSFFVGKSFGMGNQETYHRFDLYNVNHEKIKNFFRLKSPLSSNSVSTGVDVIRALKGPRLRCQYNRIFIMESSRVIHVFDPEGKEMFALQYDFNKLEVTEKHKEEVYALYKQKVPSVKANFEMLKKILKFPETFPPIRDFLIADHHIYVLPYAKENDNIYLYTFDMNGKLLNKKPVPLKLQSIMEFYPYTIQGGNLYQLVENDNEEWELQITAI